MPSVAAAAQVSQDVDMANAEAVVAPIVIHNPKEPVSGGRGGMGKSSNNLLHSDLDLSPPYLFHIIVIRSVQEYTRKKISDFLHSHTAYELIPESGKVIVIDVDLPVRQAFHALHEQVGPPRSCGCCRDFIAAKTIIQCSWMLHVYQLETSPPVICPEALNPLVGLSHAQLSVSERNASYPSQSIASAPLWDGGCNNFIGVISASDFISVLTRLRNSVSSGANPLSEAEMDAHTIRSAGTLLPFLETPPIALMEFHRTTPPYVILSFWVALTSLSVCSHPSNPQSQGPAGASGTRRS